MTHRYRLIVFDFDGTLVDSQHAIARAMGEAFGAHGLEAPAVDAVRRVVGLKLELAVARLLPDPADMATAAVVAEAYRRAFFAIRARPDHHEPLFPGARDALERLDTAEVCLGIATGKNRRGLLAGLEHHGLARYFATLQTADDGPGKPHPGMLRRAMDETGAGPAETVLIGDTTFDMEMAGNAGVAALGVAWGYHPPAELTASGAARVIDHFDDLPASLATLGAERP